WAVRAGGHFDEHGLTAVRAVAPWLPIESVAASDIVPWLDTAVASLRPDVLHLDTYWLEEHDVPRGRHLISNMQDGAFGSRSADLAIDANLDAELTFAPGDERGALVGIDSVLIREQVLVQR